MRGAARAAAIVLACALFALPLVFMVLGSLRTPGLPPPDGFEVLPDPLRWSNYETVFDFIPLWTYMRNSLFVVAVAVPITVLVGSWAGFAIATAEPRARGRLIVISLIAFMVPLSALWVPRFAMFRWMGFVDTLVPLMAPALMATTPFYVLLFALGYARIPPSLYEAARLEGLSPLQIWRRVAWPLGRPVAFAVAILAFVFHWANFVDPLLYLSDADKFTLPLGLRSLQTLEPTNHPILLAASVIATVPAVLAFFAAQRAFFRRTLEV
ncbi:MAG: carbohydrate ABC transporter permease [Actinomycetota bacterium]